VSGDQAAIPVATLCDEVRMAVLVDRCEQLSFTNVPQARMNTSTLDRDIYTCDEPRWDRY